MRSTLKAAAYTATVHGRPRSLRKPQKSRPAQITLTIVAVTSSMPTGGTSPADDTVRGTIATTASDRIAARTSLKTSEGVATTLRSVGSAATHAVVNRGGRMAPAAKRFLVTLRPGLGRLRFDRLVPRLCGGGILGAQKPDADRAGRERKDRTHEERRVVAAGQCRERMVSRARERIRARRGEARQYGEAQRTAH